MLMIRAPHVGQALFRALCVPGCIASLCYPFFESWGWAEAQEGETLHVSIQLGSGVDPE